MEKSLTMSKEELASIIKESTLLGEGSEGSVYKLPNGKTIKILDEFSKYFYNKDDSLRFSEEQIKRIYFIKQIIYMGDEICAVVSDFCPGRNLYRLDPTTVNLDSLIKHYLEFKSSIELLSSKSIKSYDMLYNVLYDLTNGFGAIDTKDYHYCTECEYSKICDYNIRILQEELLLFLTDGFLNNFVNSSSELSKMYEDVMVNKTAIDFAEFMQIFKTKLGDYCGKEIQTLKDAASAVKIVDVKYYRKEYPSDFFAKKLRRR